MLRGGAAAEILDAWSHRRRKAAVEAVQEITHRTTTDLAERDEAERRRCRRRMSEIASDQDGAKAWLMDAAMLSNVRDHGVPLPGGRVPGPEI